MGTILYIDFKRELKENVLSALSCKSGEIIEISDIINTIVYRPKHDDLLELKSINGVSRIENRPNRGK